MDDCICGIWRIKALKEINCSFNCYLQTEANIDSKGWPESGEGLIAQSFENDQIKLTIGTEDEEYLERRAKSQDWLPHRFKSEMKANLIEYLYNGIKVTVPKLFQNEQAQLHFIAAWSFKKDSDASTWYAVDQSPRNILKQVNIE